MAILSKVHTYFHKTAFGIRNAWSLKNIAPIVSIIALVVAFSSCEEELLSEDEQETSVLGNFAGENNSLQVLGGEDIRFAPGGVPLFSTNNESIVPEGAMLFVPERAYEDGVVEHSEMLALIAVPSTNWMLHQKENVPGDEWLRFSGKDFFPGQR